jgi:hypothetical protein
MNSQLTVLRAASHQAERLAEAERSRRASEPVRRPRKEHRSRTLRILRRRPVTA